MIVTTELLNTASGCVLGIELTMTAYVVYWVVKSIRAELTRRHNRKTMCPAMADGHKCVYQAGHVEPHGALTVALWTNPENLHYMTHEELLAPEPASK